MTKTDPDDTLKFEDLKKAESPEALALKQLYESKAVVTLAELPDVEQQMIKNNRRFNGMNLQVNVPFKRPEINSNDIQLESPTKKRLRYDQRMKPAAEKKSKGRKGKKSSSKFKK